MKNSLVSIIMATYNRAHFLEETLNSIQQQSFSNWELLIIDDGSADGTFELIQDVIRKDTRIKYYKRSISHKKGLPGCRNQGLEIANGDYVIFFDDDDITHPLLLELSVHELEKNSVDYCRYLRTVFKGEFIYDFNYSIDYLLSFLTIKNLDQIITGAVPLNSCQVLWRKDCFKTQRFNEELMYAEEWELYARILSEGKIGVNIEKILFFGRKHLHSNTGEFGNKKKIRIDSYIKSILLTITNLKSKNLLNHTLKHFFIRLGFRLNSIIIIKKILNATNTGLLEKIKYIFGFKIYPILRPIFYIKGKILKF